jgi:exonuclease III
MAFAYGKKIRKEGTLVFLNKFFSPISVALSAVFNMPRKAFKLLTYNIDGLNQYELVTRTTEIIGLILSEDADVIQLQEVVPDTAPVITKCLKENGYQICGTTNGSNVKFNDLGHYFTMTFVRTSFASNVRVNRVAFSGGGESFQGRDLLQTVFQFNGVQVMSLNCHLESTGTAFKSPESFIRQAQLDQAMRTMISHNGPAFVGGDLNIRDTEATFVLNKHNNALKKPNERKVVLSDVVEYLHPKGTTKGDKSCNTWVMPDRTTGRSMECRFDRVYATNYPGFYPLQVKLIGDEKIFDSNEFLNRELDTQ